VAVFALQNLWRDLAGRMQAFLRKLHRYGADREHGVRDAGHTLYHQKDLKTPLKVAFSATSSSAFKGEGVFGPRHLLTDNAGMKGMNGIRQNNLDFGLSST
jgi:hypothetical protein